jgi:hypothetical protein
MTSGGTTASDRTAQATPVERSYFAHIRWALPAAGTALIVLAAYPTLRDLSLADVFTVALIVGVLWIASLGGAGAGSVAAGVATIAYAVLRVPDMPGSMSKVIPSIFARGITFVIVGTGAGIVVSRLKEQIDKVASLSLRDSESGILSAAYTFELLRLEVEKHRRYGGAGFGVIEIHSGLSRDEAIKVARELSITLRASDSFGHSGSGGFLIVIPQGDRDSVARAARRLEEYVQVKTGVAIHQSSYVAPDDLQALENILENWKAPKA